MSDEQKPPIDERIQAALMRYWPVSIFVAALTLLSNIEEIERYSVILSTVVEKWRDVLHLAFEFPINLALRIFGMGSIDIPSPIPEVMTVISLYLFTNRVIKLDALEDSPYYKFIYGYLNFTYYVSGMISDIIYRSDIIAYYLNNFILTLSNVIFIILLFDFPIFSVYSFITFFICSIFPIMFMLISFELRDRLNIQYNYVKMGMISYVPLVLFAAMTVFITSAALEQFVEAAASFVTDATETDVKVQE